MRFSVTMLVLTVAAYASLPSPCSAGDAPAELEVYASPGLRRLLGSDAHSGHPQAESRRRGRARR